MLHSKAIAALSAVTAMILVQYELLRSRAVLTA